MQPQKQIAPGLPANLNLTPEGSDPLPAYVDDRGIYTTRWKLSLWERIVVLFRGNIWLNIMGDHPPVRMDVEAPYRVVKANIPWEIETPEHGAPMSSEQHIKPQVPEKELAEVDTWEPEDREEEKKRKEEDRGFFS